MDRVDLQAALAQAGVAHTANDSTVELRNLLKRADTRDNPITKLTNTAELSQYLHNNLGVDTHLHGGKGPGDPLTVSLIVAQTKNRGNGTKAMQAIADYADAHGLAVALTPDDMYGGSVPRLTEFYKRFGFTPNRGSKRDFSTRESMVRPPRPQAAAPIAPDTSYRMQHRAPHRTGEDDVDASDVTMAMPDFYEHPEYYTSGSRDPADRLADRQSLAALRAAHSNPDAMITVYRAVPPSVTTVNPGDWVSTSKTYATRHGFDSDDPAKDWPVISQQVRAGDLFTDGNSINEWGWDPGTPSADSPSVAPVHRLKPWQIREGDQVMVRDTGNYSTPDTTVAGLDGDLPGTVIERHGSHNQIHKFTVRTANGKHHLYANQNQKIEVHRQSNDHA